MAKYFDQKKKISRSCTDPKYFDPRKKKFWKVHSNFDFKFVAKFVASYKISYILVYVFFYHKTFLRQTTHFYAKNTRNNILAKKIVLSNIYDQKFFRPKIFSTRIFSPSIKFRSLQTGSLLNRRIWANTVSKMAKKNYVFTQIMWFSSFFFHFS